MPTIEEAIQKVDTFNALRYRKVYAVNFLIFAERQGVTRANAFSGDSGQIEVDFYIGNRMLEITLETNDSVTIAADEDHEQVYFKEGLSVSDGYQKIKQLVKAGQPPEDDRPD